MALDAQPQDTTDDMEQSAAGIPGEDAGSEGVTATIEIDINSDGSFTVEMAQPGDVDDETSESGGIQCQSIGEALKAVLTLYKQSAGASGASADDQMSEGFKSVRANSGGM